MRELTSKLDIWEEKYYLPYFFGYDEMRDVVKMVVVETEQLASIQLFRNLQVASQRLWPSIYSLCAERVMKWVYYNITQPVEGRGKGLSSSYGFCVLQSVQQNI